VDTKKKFGRGDVKIGTIAKQVGVTVEAIRFYEKKGLVAEPLRNPSGYRDYPEETLQRISFIKKSKELGFSLREIKEILQLQDAPGATCADVKQKAEQKVAVIEKRMELLLKMKEALTELIAACSGSGPASSCPIIEALNLEENKTLQRG